MGFSKKPSTMSHAQFLTTFGSIYEDSEWVARQAIEKSLASEHDTVEGLHKLFMSVVDSASHETKLKLLRAHPDLAGRAAVEGRMTTASIKEQAGAGLDQCTPEEFARFTDYNSCYRKIFDFPFIMAVKGANRHEILAAFEKRIDHDRDFEFTTALAEVHKIAGGRLEALAHRD